MDPEQTEDARAHPWWASVDPTVDGLADDEDPVTAYRAAKRPTSEPPPSKPPPDDPEAASGRWGHDQGPPHDPAVCGRCPICVGLRRLGEQHPEVLEHVLEASRHLSAAVRSLLEQRSDDGDPTAPPPAAGTPFERIDVDAPADGDGTEAGPW